MDVLPVSSRGSRMNRCIVLAGLALAAVLATAASTGRWAAQRLEALDTSFRAECQRQRAQDAALRMPVLRGLPAAGNAITEYSRLLALDIRRHRLPHQAIQAALQAEPQAPLSAEIVEYLDRSGPVLTALREAQTRARCDWRLPYELGLHLEAPGLDELRRLTELLLLEGRRRAADGDVRGSAEAYLDALRLAADLGRGTLAGVVSGARAGSRALDALGRLVVTSAWREDEALSTLQQLGSLERVLPSLESALGAERLLVGALARSLLDSPLPARIEAARRLPLLARAYAELEHKAREADWQGWDEQRQRLERLASRSALAALLVPDLRGLRNETDALQARYRLVRAALLLEHRWAGSQALFPLDESLVDRAADPFAPASELRYEPAPDGMGYRLWSVGPDGREVNGAVALRRDSRTTKAALKP
jgi:hypothetical protein